MSVTAVVGEALLLEATFYDQPGGAATDPSSVTLVVLDVNDATAFGPFTYAAATIDRVSEGFYRKSVAIPSTATPGTYTARWTAVIDGNSRIGYETVVLTAAVTSTSPGSTTRDATGVWYATREQVMFGPDVRDTALNARQVDEAIEAASRMIDIDLHRTFFPMLETRTFDWPARQSSQPYRLWLDANELIEVYELTVGGIEVAEGDYMLRPDAGPPYSHVELDISGNTGSFTSGSTHQRQVSIYGLFGYSANELTATTLDGAVLVDDETIDAASGGTIGVGTILRVDSERMIITERSMLDTGENLAVALTAQASDTLVQLADASSFAYGEVILIDAERMLVMDKAGNNLIVKRGWDGTVLATHNIAADVYAGRRLHVTRGALGTAAATHADGATVYRHVVPGAIATLCRGQALFMVRQEHVNYGRTGGAGIAQRAPDGRALDVLWERAGLTMARKGRTRAVR